MRALARENPEKITIKRKWIASSILRVFLVRIRDKRVDGAIELVVSTIPIQTIVPAFIADQFLRKLLGKLTRRAGEILPLRFDQLAARFRRIGRNGLAAMETCRQLGERQRQYFTHPAGKLYQQFASKLVSEYRPHNGLSWE